MSLESQSSLPIAAQLSASLSHLNRQLRRELPQSDLSAAGLGLLARLHRDPGVSPTRLASSAGIKVQSLTRLLADLEAGGHIRREADAADRRQSVLSLTNKGRQSLKSEARRREAALANAIAASLSTPEQALLLQAVQLLDRVGDVLASAAMEPSGPTAPRRVAKRQG